jgi:bromodomain-containing factor 1
MGMLWQWPDDGALFSDTIGCSNSATNGHDRELAVEATNGNKDQNDDVEMDDAVSVPNGKSEPSVTAGADVTRAPSAPAAQAEATEPSPQPEETTEVPSVERASSPPPPPSKESESAEPPIEQPPPVAHDEPVVPENPNQDQDSILPDAPAPKSEITPVPQVQAPDEGESPAKSPPIAHTEPAASSADDAPVVVEPSTNASATPGETQPSIEESQSAAPMAAPSTGQVRPRDDDDGSEPSAKRTKVESVDGDVSMQNVAAAAEPNTSASSSSMAPPPLPGAAEPNYGNLEITKSQHRYLVESVRKAKKIKAAGAFLTPVDHVAMNIPTYPTLVPNPMDLSTIEDKLKHFQYKSPTDFWSDFNLMVENAVTFNGREHPVSHNAMNLRQYFAKLMQTMPSPNEAPLPDKKKTVIPVKTEAARRPVRTASVPKEAPAPPPPVVAAPTPVPSPAAPAVAPKAPTPLKQKEKTQAHESFLDADGIPLIRRDSQSERPKRDIIKPRPRDLLYSAAKPKKKQYQLELQFCHDTMKELKKAKYSAISWPFMNAVDPVALNIPTYHKIIKKPMDFGTIDKNEQAGTYGNAKEFHNDAKLVFANCYKFNLPGDSVYDMGKQFEAIFDSLWAKKDEWIANNQPPPESEAESEAESSEEEEDDDEADENDPMRRVMELQQQIAALSAEVINLTNAQQAKVMKPKKSKKSSKSKPEAAKKQKRPSTGHAAASAKTSKSSKKVKKEKKMTKLTIEQKRYVSEAIMNLDEPNMRKCVQMIRNGVPKLKVRKRPVEAKWAGFPCQKKACADKQLAR